MMHLLLFPCEALCFCLKTYPLLIGRKSSIAAIQQAVRMEKPIGLLMQQRDKDEEPGANDLYTIGTVLEILRYLKASDGSHHLICRGLQRFRIKELLSGYPFLVAR